MDFWNNPCLEEPPKQNMAEPLQRFHGGISRKKNLAELLGESLVKYLKEALEKTESLGEYPGKSLYGFLIIILELVLEKPMKRVL